MKICSDYYLVRFQIHTDESRLPWVGAGIGIILGVFIVISDSVLTKAPTLTVRRTHTNPHTRKKTIAF